MPLRAADSDRERRTFPKKRRPPVPDRQEGRVGLGMATAAVLLFLLLPPAALVAAVSPEALLAALQEPSVRAAARVSLTTSALATLLSTAAGLPVAYLLARFRFPGKAVLDTLLDLPMVLPPVVAGLALLLVFGRMGWIGRHLEPLGIRIPFTTAAVVLAQTFMAAPFFIRAARAGIEAVPEQLEHAAMTLGRNRWGAFWSVTAPLAGPALLAGAVLAWARALSEFGATMLFAGNAEGVTQTLPQAVMTAFEEPNLPLAAAISLLSLYLAFAALLGARLVLHRCGHGMRGPER